MPRVKPSTDIQPLSEVRANLASYIDQVRQTGRPVVLTEHGRGAAVLLGVTAYEALVEELELLRDVQTAEEQLAAGRAIGHTRAKRELRRRLAR